MVKLYRRGMLSMYCMNKEDSFSECMTVLNDKFRVTLLNYNILHYKFLIFIFRSENTENLRSTSSFSGFLIFINFIIKCFNKQGLKLFN